MRGHSPSKTVVNALMPAHPSSSRRLTDCRVMPAMTRTSLRKQEGPSFRMAPHCLAENRLLAEPGSALGAIHSGRGFDPACRDRRMTMRHWITSFQLVDDAAKLGWTG